MKKNDFYKVMMMAIVVLVSMTFTACGGDDDDDPITNPSVVTPGGDNGEQIGGDTTSSLEFVLPCLEWNASRTQVKEYMSTATGWMLQTDANYLMYENNQGTQLDYNFGIEGEKLVQVRVAYKNTTEKDWQWLIQETQNIYNTTLHVEGTAGSEYAAAGGTVTINGVQVDVTLLKMGTGVYMSWAPAE